MYCPVGSNRAAKTSPEWPVSSITGDCSALLREPYAAYQHVQASAIVVFSQTASISTYRLDERSILPAAIHYCDGRFTSWLEPKPSCAGRFAVDIAASVCGVEYRRMVVPGVDVCVWRVHRDALVNFLEADLRQATRDPLVHDPSFPTHLHYSHVPAAPSAAPTSPDSAYPANQASPVIGFKTERGRARTSLAPWLLQRPLV
jgi:hypothetical protein